MADGKILLAVDFGTTFSGAAYAYVEKGDDPREVEVNLIEDDWPGMGSQSSQKVPSVFKFDKTAPGGFKWGFQLDDDPDRICFSKLYLDPKQIHAAQTLATFSTKPGKLPPNRKVTDGISKYLEAVRAVALDRMEADWGKDFLDSTPMETILTVPAVWSDKAKSDTLQCAHKAGFGELPKIRLITEPEAAAVYTFHQLPEFSVKKGHVFITVDAGGGTVDLTTYQVYETTPTLRVDELTIGSGGLCGSVYLNRRFEELIQQKIGTMLKESLSRVEALEALDEIQNVFNEDIKPNFGTTSDEKKEYDVPVPSVIKDDADLNIRDGKLWITTAELKEVYDPVISMIIQLIIGQLEQVDAAPGNLEVAAILLVGGFGSSEYLRKEIETHFSGEEGLPAIKVIQPVNAWSAVTRGAMLRGIQGDIVETRIIRHHYGIVARVPWDPNVHEKPDKRRQAETNKIFDATEQKTFCNNVMYWYVKKGDKFSSKRMVTFDFYRALTNLNNLVFTTNLIVYTGRGDEAPYFVDSDCRTVATLTSDLSGIPHSQFDVVNSGGGEWYKISYDIEMSFEAAIAFRLLFKGKVLGECGVDYRG